jgi:hypothetical protein
MTVIDLPIHHDEWVRLRDAVVAVDADDLVNPPVLVHPHRAAVDRPHWRIRGYDGTMIEIRHDIPSGPPFTVALACQAVKHGALLAIREGSCTLTLDTSGYARLNGQNGSYAVLDLPPVPTAIDLPSGIQPSASGTATAVQIADAIYSGTRLPEGVEDDVIYPSLEIGIEAGAIGFGADWRTLGRPRSTYRAPATTNGTAVVGFHFGTVRSLLMRSAERDQNVVVSVLDDWVRFETEDWIAWANQVETSAARWLPEIAGNLEAAGFSVQPLDSSALQVDGQHQIRIQAVRGVSEVLRISTVLGTGLSASTDLRAEIDKIMSSRIGLRLWFEEDRLIAAEDLACEQLSVLPATIRRFGNQLMGLDLLLTTVGEDQGQLFSTGDDCSGDPSDSHIEGAPRATQNEIGETSSPPSATEGTER